MSLHQTLFAAAGLEQILRAQGESIEYTAKHAQPVSLTALVGPEQSKTTTDGRGRKTVRLRCISVTKNEAGPFGGLLDPQENAVLTYDGIDYALSERHDGGTFWQLIVNMIGRNERSRPGLRARE